MPKSNCEKCAKDFAYDLDLGLNVKFYESEATSTAYYGNGDFPCCPGCEARCSFQQNIGELSDIKVKTRQSDNIKIDTVIVQGELEMTELGINFMRRVFGNSQTKPNGDGTFTHRFTPQTEDYKRLKGEALEESKNIERKK